MNFDGFGRQAGTKKEPASLSPRVINTPNEQPRSRLECVPLQAPPKSDSAEAEVANEKVDVNNWRYKHAAEQNVTDIFQNFMVDNCKCFSNDVRDKLLTIIEAGCGTLDEFDAELKDEWIAEQLHHTNFSDQNSVKSLSE